MPHKKASAKGSKKDAGLKQLIKTGRATTSVKSK